MDPVLQTILEESPPVDPLINFAHLSTLVLPLALEPDFVSSLGIVFRSESMAEVVNLSLRFAKSSIPVLITGESGVGKEKIARLIHEQSPRRQYRFIPINCGAIPENLLESELFGHHKGAFTGADSDKKGFFEAANGGTLFLDEVGELPLFMQVKLLRVLQDGEITPLGSDSVIKTDVRILSATNRNLAEDMAAGRFREDLFYRLNVADIFIPPLRSRREDIPPLARLFLAKFSRKEGVREKILSPRALAKLFSHNWPGNVRQLENFLYKLAVYTARRMITEREIEKLFEQSLKELPGSSAAEGLSLSQMKKRFEKEQIVRALKLFKGNISQTATYLKVARPRLSFLLKEHKINRAEFVL